MTDDEVHDMVALYVVHALSPEEMADFEDHLADCAECQREVRAMRSITERLTHSVAADPPQSLRSSVLNEITRTAQDSRADETVRAVGGEPARAPQPAAPHGVIPLRSRGGERLAYLAAAAALLVAVGLGGWALQSRHDADQASERQAELVSLLGARDVRAVSAPVQGGGSGTVVLSQAQSEAVFVSSGLAALPSGKVYELWTITSKPRPAGTFMAGGEANLVTLPTAALSAATLAVTVEPSGGSTQPTTTPILALSLRPRS